jgi:hypothetical protein
MSQRTSLTALSAATLVTPTSKDSAAYIFSLSLTPTYLAALSASTLHLLSPSTLRTQQTLSTHGSHTLLRAASATSLLTAGEDGTITHHDVRSSSSSTFFSAPAALSSLTTSSTNGLIAAGTLLNESTSTSTVFVFDPRNGNKPLRTYKESHSDDVTALAFSPSGERLASGGTDGYVNLFSLAAPAGNGEGDDEVDGALLSVINHGSVHRVGFLGASEEALWVKSHDEVLAMYELGEEGRDYKVGDVRKAVEGCEYVVDLLPRAQQDAWVVAGSMSGAWVDLVPIDNRGAWVDGGFRLVGGHGEEVCRDVVVDAVVGFSFGAVKGEGLIGADEHDIYGWRGRNRQGVAAADYDYDHNDRRCGDGSGPGGAATKEREEGEKRQEGWKEEAAACAVLIPHTPKERNKVI